MFRGMTWNFVTGTWYCRRRRPLNVPYRTAAVCGGSFRGVGSACSFAAVPDVRISVQSFVPTLPTMSHIRFASPAARTVAALTVLLTAAACGESKEHARADSLNAIAAAEQLALSNQLAAQKDSLMTVVLEADQFINQIDSSISRVKDLPKRERRQAAEGVLQDQLEARKDMLHKVDALVKRAQTTARQLAESRRQNKTLRDSVDKSEMLIAQMGETIQRQTTQIAELQTSVNELTETNARLGEELRVSLASNAKVYYIIGREDDLLKKGVIVKEGGMNLLVARVGKTLQPARSLDPSLFTPIDAREVSRIPVPDSTKTYRIVSRHSLDDALVTQRDKANFRGDLQITDANRFWSPSRYLIVVQG